MNMALNHRHLCINWFYMKGKILCTIVSLALAAGSVSAQNAQGSNRAAQRNYDVSTETTIHGTISAIERPASGRGQQGVHLVVQTSTGENTVHVGPQWYVDKQSMTLSKGDDVQVAGSRVTLDGSPVIIARTITKGTHTMQLRRADGTPLWAGRGRSGR